MKEGAVSRNNSRNNSPNTSRATSPVLGVAKPPQARLYRSASIGSVGLKLAPPFVSPSAHRFQGIRGASSRV